MRRPIALIRRAITRWQLGNSPSARERFTDDGDTLVEVLLAIVVLGIAAVALLTGFATSISASSEHRNLASLDSSTRLASNVAIADVQQQAVSAAGDPANDPFLCNNSWPGPNFDNVTGYTVSSGPVGYWNGSAFASTCTNYAPQQYTLTIRSNGSTAYSTSVSTVIYNPSAPPRPDGVGSPSQLVWLSDTSSITGTVGTPINPQPEVAVEDALNNIVTSDLSSVTLQVLTGPTLTFSNTCSGVESYGIVQFSNCSLSTAGTYTIRVVDSSSGVAPTSSATVVVNGASVAKLVFSTAPVSGTASNTANLGLITVQEQDFLGNPTFTAETVTLTSSSSHGVFSLTAGGAPVTSVTIPGGTVSTVSFYYGDTVAGSPVLTANFSPPNLNLALGQQTETVNPGPAATFSLSTPTPTTGTAFPEAITAFDAFGNVATGYKGTQCIVFSGPGNAPKGNVPTYPGKGTCPTGASSVSFTNGVANPSITLFKAGNTTLTATQGTITGSVSFNVATGTFGALSVANPGPQTAGTAFSVTLTGTDAYGNPFTGTVSPTFSGPSNSPNGKVPAYPATVTFTNGTATATPVTLYDAQSTTLKVTSGAVSGTSTSFTVAAGPFAGFTMSNPTPTAGTAFNETITAGDAYGNGGTGFSGTQCISFSGPANSPNGNAPIYPAAGGSCTTGSAVTFTAGGVGTASITLFNAGSTVLTAASVATPAITGTATFTVASAAAKTFTIPTPPATQTAGTAFTLSIGATDTYGNPFGGTLTGGANGLSFSGPANSPAPSNKAPAYPTSLTFTNGAANASITLYDAQSTTLTVAATGVTPATTPITVIAGGASKFALSTPSPTAGTPFTETITAVDGFANTATGFTGTQCVVLTGPANSPNGTAPTYPAATGCANGSSLTFNTGVDNAVPITLTDAQSTTLTGTQGPITGTSANFTVSPAAATTLAATSGANQSATTNAAFTNKLVATATDSLGNPVSGVAVTFAAPASGASATFAACSSNSQAYSCTQNTGANGQATSSTFTANGTNGTYTITATATGLTSATFAEANKSNQTITFTSTAPGNATVGGATYTPTATASSGLAVTITVDASSAAVCSINGGGVVSFTGSGTCTLDANQAGSNTFNAAPQVQQAFGVKRNQTISFTSTAPGAATVGGATYTPTATATSGLAVTITVDGSSSGICSISGGAVSFQTPGSCVLDANQAGNGTYNAAPQVQQTFNVAKGNQTITFTSTAPGAAAVGGATYTAAATASSGLTVTFTSGTPTVCTSSGTNGSVFTFVGNGTCTVNANQAGGTNYNAAPQVQQSFGVKHSQTINFTSTAPSGATVGGATYTPTATATSGLAVTITLDGSSTGCSINAGVVSFQSPGTCVIDGNQAGNTGFYAAPQVQQTFNVAKGNQTITFTSTAPGAATVGGATYTAAATASSALTVAFSSGSTAVCTSSGTNGSVFTFVGSGSCIVDANQAGNGSWNAANQAQQTFTVSKQNQTISFTSTAPGGASVGGATYTPTATATSGLAVTITVDGSSSGICSTTGGAVSFQTPGSCVLDANQTGNGTYNAAPQVQQTFNVAKGNQTITFTSTAPSTATVGGATYTAAATASSALTVTFTSGTPTVCTSSGTNGSVFTFVANGTCTVNANQAGSTNYNAALQVQQSFGVKHSQTINFTSTAPTSASAGGTTYTPAATATSSLAVTITLDGSSTGCSINAGVVSFQSAGSCVIDANQAGSAGFYAAPQAQQSFAVTGLTITSAQLSTAGATAPRMTLSGNGAAGANTVSVSICAVNAFPCSFGNRVATVATGTNPANPWTTAATSTTALDYATTYYAQATQGTTQTSVVFIFATPVQNAPTAVVLANGTGTARTIDQNDTATITFSGQLNASSICSTWTNTGTQTLGNATITFTSAGNNDTFTATSATCTGNGNFGTVSTGGNYVGGTVTFTNSTISWNPTTDVLTFKLGGIGSGSGNRQTGVTVHAPGYTADPQMTDTSGIPISTTTFTSGNTSGF